MAEITSTVKRQYKDLASSFGLNPVTNDVLSVSGADAVIRAVKSLLMTDVGEVPFFPTFGSRVKYLLFEPVDPVTTAALDDEIRATIQAFEPRAKIHTLHITPTVDDAQYQIDLTIQIVNLLDPITLTLFLSRLR